jgi:hypothetical protein
MKRLIPIILIFLTSCSAEWHLQRAVKKNPKYGQPTTMGVPIIIKETVTVKVPGDTSQQFMKMLEWYKRAKDSTATVYQDSLLHVQQEIQDGVVVTKVIRIPYEVKVPFEVHDTVKVECPPQVTVEQKKSFSQIIKEIGSFIIWFLILIVVILSLLLLHRYKK